jgi:sulfatase modifying factor 1
MRSLLSRGLWVVVPFLAAAAGHVGTEAEKEEERRRIANLIKQLGHDEYARREKAGDDLRAIGEPALPHLREAEGSSENPEVRHRARGIVRAILAAARRSRSTGMEFVVVSPGAFDMGSRQGPGNVRRDERQHKVHLTRPYLLGACEVTQGQYEAVMKANPSYFSKAGPGKDRVAGEDTSRFPVERVTWFDALEFCNRLSKLDGYPPHYELADVKRDGESITRAAVKVLGGKGYRLPTEAEWEYACRAGTTTDFHFGFVRNGKEANFKVVISGGYGTQAVNSQLGRTSAVGSYKPNNWGFYDMHGNAAEWCWDWYDENYYANSPEADPPGPDSGKHRVLRGGSWLVGHTSARSATRFSHLPDDAGYYTGFRVARSP